MIVSLRGDCRPETNVALMAECFLMADLIPDEIHLVLVHAKTVIGELIDGNQSGGLAW